MFSEEKIKQVFNAIKDNGLSAFDDVSLAKLLSILNKKELDYFEEYAYKELDNPMRISQVKQIVLMNIDRELNKIRSSQVYSLYIESIKRDDYYNFFKKLKVEELGEIKKYVINTYTPKTEKATKKIVNMITQELYVREANKNLVF